MKKKQIWPIIFVLSFLFSSTSLQAWYEKTHAYAARLVMELIQKIDKEKRYEELYSQPFVIEVGRGAWREDFNPPIEGNARAFRHFFDPDSRGHKGAEFFFHFYLWTTFEGEAVKQPPSLHYEDALSWARNGAGTKNNPFHWEGAIEAYDYTTNSRREAYYRLGHVLHLLVDMSEPDHASNMPHPGSGKIIPDTIDEMFGTPVIQRLKKLGSSNFTKIYKPNIKTEAFKTLLNVFYLMFQRKTVKKNERLTGFEGLIEENVDHRLVADFFLNDEAIKLQKKPLLTQAVPPIRAQRIEKAKDLDDYFIKMAKMSKASQKMSGLPLALGCEDIGSLLVSAIRYEPIYILPTIDTNDPSAQTPYYDLAWPLIEKSVEYSAGLMEDFHDIVNHPPYVQSINLVQAGGGSYRARWEDILGTRPTGRTEELFYDVKYRGFQNRYDYVKERKLVTSLNGTFMTDIPIKITIHFGSDAYAVEERIDPASIEVRLGGEMAAGQMIGSATWEGSFLPRVGENRGSREFKLEIGARDLHDHFPRSGYPDKGYLLDVDPETPARSSSRPPYDWQGYRQGPDKNHSISVFSEPVAEPEPKEEIIESGGGCPIPAGAKLSESNIVKGYKKLIGNVHRNVGPYLRWYDSSKTQLSMKFCYDAQGRKTGTALHWYEDGTLSRRSEYEAGELNGADIVYHRNGKARFETHYSKGKKSGPYRSWGQGGNLMSSGQYADDKKTGIWSSYNQKGCLTTERSYSEDQLNGPSVFYRVQGDTQPGDPRRIDYKCEYKNNKLNGMSVEYYEDGTVYQTIEYREGKKDGVMKEYFSSGEIKLEVPFRDDKRHGTMVEYARNGEVVYKWILENGDPVRKLDKDGNVVEVYKKKER